MLIGNLTRDPEARTTPNGQNVCTFSIATSRQWTDAGGARQEKTEFHNLVAWGKLADICKSYLQKGKKIYAEGRLQTRDWTGDDGVKRYRTEIVLENMIMLDRGGSQGGAPSTIPPPSPASSVTLPASQPPTEEGPQEMRVEDIPF